MPSRPAKPSASTKKAKGAGQVVLIADDDPVVRAMLRRHVERAGYTTLEAEDGQQAINQMRDGIAVALLDLHMPNVSGMECLTHLRTEWPDTQAIMITSSDDVSAAVTAMKEGAKEYISKPVDPEELVVLIERAVAVADLTRDHRGLTAVVSQSLPTPTTTASSKVACKLFKQVDRVASLDSTVLITGDSGTGKTTIARMIHRQGPRGEQPFVAVNCASLPRDLIEAELFGHAKGAFTGAIGERPGHIEIANGGTLFLDEIGDLPLELQPKLLTFLQDRKIRRIGATEEIDVDVRLIAATHCDLETMCAEKRFRQDLFYRLNVLRLTAPPVRERREDIPGLVQSILGRLADRQSVEPPQVEPAAMQLLINYEWPGNIREMENVLERAIAFLDQPLITVSDLALPQNVANGHELSPAIENVDAQLAFQGADEVKTLAEIERMAIEAALVACGGNKAKTARQLGISEKSIYNKMRRHGIAKEKTNK